MGEGRPAGNRFLGLSNPSIHHLSLNRFVGVGGSEACPRGGIEGGGMASSSLNKHKGQVHCRCSFTGVVVMSPTQEPPPNFCRA